jgi:hypothetical protein
MTNTKMTVLWAPRAPSLGLAAVVLAAAGCMQVDITVEVHDEDGGATVTERLCVSRKLQQACTTNAQRERVMGFLSKGRAQNRVKIMGKGVKLVSHKTRSLPNGSKEGVAVYEVAELGNLRLPNPLIDSFQPSAAFRFRQWMHRAKPRTSRHNDKHVFFALSFDNKRTRNTKLERVTRTPAERQILRELKPLIADMVSDFHMRLRLKVPTRFTSGSVRDLFAAPKVATLFSLSGWSGDTRGGRFFENEEILIKLLELDLDAGVLYANTGGAFEHNFGVPVVRGRRYNRCTFSIYPTKHMLKKYLKPGEKPPAK